MNLFENYLIGTVLILFPLAAYILYLSTNKNITIGHKKIFFSFSCISSFFLIFKYLNNPILNILLLSSIVLIGYLKNKYIISNIIVIFIMIGYYRSVNCLVFMIIPYLLLNIVNVWKKHHHISDYIYIDIFLLIQYIFLLIWFRLFNIDLLHSFNLFNLSMTMILNYVVIHIIYYLYDEGEKIISYHMSYRELIQERQIRLSLFKITHEIKNPIAVIKAYLDMLNINNSKQVHKYIPIIKNEIDRLLVLLQDFMLVNKNNIEKDIMDINMLLEDVIESLKPLIKEHNIELSNDIIDDETYIDGDYKRLGQVFINLIKNSIEAIDGNNGHIKIKDYINDNKLHIIIAEL